MIKMRNLPKHFYPVAKISLDRKRKILKIQQIS